MSYCRRGERMIHDVAYYLYIFRDSDKMKLEIYLQIMEINKMCDKLDIA